MDTTLGRWLLIGLIFLIALALLLVIPRILQIAEEAPLPPTIARPAPTSSSSPPATISPQPRATTDPTPGPPTATPSPTPTPTPTPLPEPTPLPPIAGYTAHTVAEGETLEEIATRYGSIAPAIASLNRFPADAPLSEGQPLVVPLYVGLDPSAPFETEGLEIARGLDGRRVALTLDAGAGAAPAEQILDTLQERDLQITFFLTGRWAEENPDLVRRIAAEGHEIANHTYSHPHLTELEADEVHEELARTEAIIRDLAGQSTRPMMRPPFGDRDAPLLDILAEAGYISIYWTLDSLDSVGEPKSAEYLFQRVTENTVEGAIILMHIGNQTTAEALPAILEWYETEGWEVVRVSEILRLP